MQQRIELSYALAPPAPAPDAGRIRNPLMDLLQAVREHGSISGAARALGLSYRHVWGELKRWEAQLGQPLIVWEQGPAGAADRVRRQAAVGRAPGPGPAGAADRGAARRPGARLRASPSTTAPHVLSLYASHDDALALLREHAAASAALHLDIRFTGSVDAIRALNEGRCAMAGFHTLEPAPARLAGAAHLPAAAASPGSTRSSASRGAPRA